MESYFIDPMRGIRMIQQQTLRYGFQNLMADLQSFITVPLLQLWVTVMLKPIPVVNEWTSGYNLDEAPAPEGHMRDRQHIHTYG